MLLINFLKDVKVLSQFGFHGKKRKLFTTEKGKLDKVS